MAEHFLSKIRVAPEDFVDANGTPVLEQHAALRGLLEERAGPEVASLFAEPLISRGNDEAPPTVSWYGDVAGEARPLNRLPPGERDRAERYLSDHLRPLRPLTEDSSSADLALGALSVFGKDDVLVVGDRPVIVNWGLLPGGDGANIASKSAHYDATLGRFLPLGASGQSVQETPNMRAVPATPAGGAAARAVQAAAATGAVNMPPDGGLPPGSAGPRPRRLPLIAWVPLLILLILAGLTLAWLLMPGTRLFHASDTPPPITDEATLQAELALNESLRARKAKLEEALAGAVCRPDGVLILPGGLTPDGLVPPKEGVKPEDKASASPEAILPTTPNRVEVPDPSNGQDGQTQTLLELIEARTVMILAGGGTGSAVGSGLVVGPGLIVTNQHVISHAAADTGDGWIVVLNERLDGPSRAQLLKADGPMKQTGSDFALLKIENTSLPAYALHQSQSSLKLVNVIAAGFPGDVLGLDADFNALRSGDRTAVPELTVTDGTVNTEQQLGPKTHVLMHSAPLSSGNSGGPLIDMCGRVVGVNTFVLEGPMQNRGFALNIDNLLRFLQGTDAAPAVVSETCAPVVVRPQVVQATAPAAPTPGAAPKVPLPLPDPSE
jgi:S1-C subfamily serine protease